MNVRLQYTAPFTAGVYYNDQFRMNNYTLTLWMITNSTDPTDHDTCFERIKYFVNAEMDSTVFINDQNVEQCQKFIDASITVTTMPGDPVDQLVGIMLYYKLNAITEGRMIIVETELSSQLGSGMVYLHGENESVTAFKQPDWWQSADLVHCDPEIIGNDKVVVHQASVWRDLDLHWIDNVNVDTQDNTVVFADFKKTDDTK